MRSKVLQKVLDETPEKIKVLVSRYSDLVVKMNAIIRETGDENNLMVQKLKQELFELYESRKKSVH